MIQSHFDGRLTTNERKREELDKYLDVYNKKKDTSDNKISNLISLEEIKEKGKQRRNGRIDYSLEAQYYIEGYSVKEIASNTKTELSKAEYQKNIDKLEGVVDDLSTLIRDEIRKLEEKTITRRIKKIEMRVLRRIKIYDGFDSKYDKKVTTSKTNQMRFKIFLGKEIIEELPKSLNLWLTT